jgi:hypothetical protein
LDQKDQAVLELGSHAEKLFLLWVIAAELAYQQNADVFGTVEDPPARKAPIAALEATRAKLHKRFPEHVAISASVVPYRPLSPGLTCDIQDRSDCKSEVLRRSGAEGKLPKGRHRCRTAGSKRGRHTSCCGMQARAILRCGELLKAIEPASQAQLKRSRRDTSDPPEAVRPETVSAPTPFPSSRPPTASFTVGLNWTHGTTSPPLAAVGIDKHLAQLKAPLQWSATPLRAAAASRRLVCVAGYAGSLSGCHSRLHRNCTVWTVTRLSLDSLEGN